MIRKLFPALLILSASLILSACTTESEDEGGSINTTLLVNEWKVTAVTVNIPIPVLGSNLFGLFSDCDRSVVLEFKANGTFTRTPDEDECDDADEVADAASSGTYTVSGNTLTVDETSEDDVYVFTITELTATTLKMTEPIGADEFGDDKARVGTTTYTAL